MASKVTVCNFCTFDKITREKIVDCSKFATKYGVGASGVFKIFVKIQQKVYFKLFDF